MKTKFYILITLIWAFSISQDIHAQNLDVEGYTRLDGGSLSNPVNIYSNINSNWTGIYNTHGYRGYFGIFNGAHDMDFGTGSGNTEGKVHLVTNASPKLTVIPNGNVGIGTINASEKLHVMGNIRLDASGTKAINFYNGTSLSSYLRNFSSGLIQWVNSSTTGNTQIWTNAGNTLALELDEDGVARSPHGRYGGNGDGLAWTLGVTGSTILRGDESNGSTTGALNIRSGSQSMWLDGNEIDASIDHLNFNYNTNSSIIMRNTERRADVNVGHTSGSGVDDGFSLENQAGNNNYWTMYVLNNGGELEYYFKGVLKGRFDDSSGAYTTVSDRNLKRDISDLDNVLPKIMQIEPKRYKFIDDENNRDYVGFIAQDLEPLFPEAVFKGTIGDTNEERYTLDYSSMSAVAIQAIKEQQLMINELKEQLESVKADLESLKRD